MTSDLAVPSFTNNVKVGQPGMNKLSKIVYYLIGNLCIDMLSYLEGRSSEKRWGG